MRDTYLASDNDNAHAAGFRIFMKRMRSTIKVSRVYDFRWKDFDMPTTYFPIKAQWAPRG